jgi:hypothetical protein
VPVGPMICLCCYSRLVDPNGLPTEVAPAKPGDRYCLRCRWFFAREMIEPERTMALDGIWRCPTHGRRSGW